MTESPSRRTVLSAGLAAVVAGLVSGCGSGAPPTPTPTSGGAAGSFSPTAVEALDALMNARIGPNGAPGGVLGVWSGDRVLRKAYGVADHASNEPMRPDSVFRIASITKTFAASAVLLLADRGSLTLDDTLSKYVPGVANGDRITIRQLLNMTAGVHNYTGDAEFGAAFDKDPAAPFTVEQALRIIRAGVPAFPPGETGQWQYSDSNYLLLDPVIRAASGRSPAEVIEAEILSELGLTATGYPSGPDLPPGASRGYAPSESGGEPRDVTRVEPGVAGPAGAMTSTVDDLRVWAKALSDGVLLSDRARTEQQTFVPAITSGAVTVDYGLGVMRINQFIGHNGAIYGFNSAMLRHPPSDSTFVVMLNRSDNAANTALEVALGAVQVLFPHGVGR